MKKLEAKTALSRTPWPRNKQEGVLKDKPLYFEDRNRHPAGGLGKMAGSGADGISGGLMKPEKEKPKLP